MRSIRIWRAAQLDRPTTLKQPLLRRVASCRYSRGDYGILRTILRQRLRMIEQTHSTRQFDNASTYLRLIQNKIGGRHHATSWKGSTCMSELLSEKFKNALPKIGDQEGNTDPAVFAVFRFPLSGWIWFATEGAAYGDDIRFFGYVVGLEREWGYFCLSEL